MFIKTILAMTLLAGIATITACATTGPSGKAEIDTWKGATVDELYQTYGTPSNTTEQSDGITIVEFQYSRTGSTPYYCTVRYTVDSSGVVASGTYEGNIGGCNHLIKVNPKTP